MLFRGEEIKKKHSNTCALWPPCKKECSLHELSIHLSSVYFFSASILAAIETRPHLTHDVGGGAWFVKGCSVVYRGMGSASDRLYHCRLEQGQVQG